MQYCYHAKLRKEGHNTFPKMGDGIATSGGNEQLMDYKQKPPPESLIPWEPFKGHPHLAIFPTLLLAILLGVDAPLEIAKSCRFTCKSKIFDGIVLNC